MLRLRKSLWLLVLLGLLPALRAVADTVVLPEVLLVTDTSASMQYRIGADKAPLCGSIDPTVPDEKSRWTAVREMIGGSFTSYSCKYVTMPQTSESIAPPPQVFGDPICIPGLAHILGSNYTVDPLHGTGTSNSSGNCTNSGACQAATMTLRNSTASNIQVPWVRFDITDIPFDKPWVAGALTLTDTGTYVSSGTGFQGVLVLGDPDPEASPAAFVCSADGPPAKRQVLSLATTLNYAAGAQTQFALTATGAQKLHDLRAAGQTVLHLAVVPAATTLDDPCSGIVGSPAGERIQWYGADATPANLPQFLVQSGQQCPGEGPTVHSEAWGISDLLVPSTMPAGKDGILYTLGPSAKFGLFPTDGVLSQSTTAAGGFSFAGALGSLWGDINLGMAGPFLDGTTAEPVTRSDDLAPRTATYNNIQSKLQLIQPNNPTPLGDQLADIVAYMGPGDYMDPHFKSLAEDPINGDPYSACRKHIVAVFSDGGANLHNGVADGRAFAIQQAAKLYAANVPVYVLAVGHPADGSQGPPSADLDFLNELALAGGTVAATVVSTPAAAVKVLSPAIAATAVVGEVLTRPLYSRATGINTDTQHSFEAISIYDISQPLRTRGIVEQRIWRCTGECKSATGSAPNMAQVCDVLNYQDQLKNRSLPRRIYTQKFGARIDATADNLTPFDLGIGTVGFGPRLELDVNTDCLTGTPFDLSQVADRNAYRSHVLDTLVGAHGSCRQNHPLGAPSRAQPALLESADRLSLRDPSFLQYAAAVVPTTANYSDLSPPGSAGRPTMLFVATHDGLLHAFRTDQNPKILVQDNLKAGDEMWAWLPKFELGRISQMRLVTTPNSSYLGGSITTGHVLLSRSSASIADAAKQWRAVVVVGAGEAGDAYTALDVTAPDDPRLLWEIAPDQHCFGNVTVTGVTGPNCVATTKFADMGRSTAKPVIASLFYDNGTSLGERAVVILPMGKPAADAEADNLGVEGAGNRGVMIVDLATGDLVRKFVTTDLVLDGATTPVPDRSQLGNFWAEAACYDNAPGHVVNRCFLGDSKGVLWRLDLASTDPNNWKLQFFFDSYWGPDTVPTLQLPLTSTDRVPILGPASMASTASAPVGLEPGQSSKMTMVFGTGGVDRVATPARKNIVYSLAEVFTSQPDGTPNPLPIAKRVWLAALDDYERYVGPPLIFASDAYWATYKVLQDGACDVGTARLWGVRFDRTQTASDPTSLSGVFPDSATPALASANHSFVEVGAYKPSPVDVQPVPSCVAGCAPTDANCARAAGGQLGGAKPKYQIGVAVSGNVQGAYQTPKVNTGTQASVGTIAKDIPQPKSAATVTGWDLLLD